MNLPVKNTACTFKVHAVFSDIRPMRRNCLPHMCCRHLLCGIFRVNVFCHPWTNSLSPQDMEAADFTALSCLSNSALAHFRSVVHSQFLYSIQMGGHPKSPCECSLQVDSRILSPQGSMISRAPSVSPFNIWTKHSADCRPRSRTGKSMVVMVGSISCAQFISCCQFQSSGPQRPICSGIFKPQDLIAL